MDDILSLPPPPFDARIAYGPEPQHFGELRLPGGRGPHPLVVVIHGGFWRNRYDLKHIGHLCAALTAQGCVTWNIEYRRVGDSGGGFPGTFHDVSTAINHVRRLAEQYPLDLTRVAALGHSAGGHLALWATGRHRVSPSSEIYSPDPFPVRAAVSLAGVVDLRRASELRLSSGVTDELMGGSPGAYPERYAAASPLELVPLGRPAFLVHGTADGNVPFEISQRYYETAHAHGDAVTLIALPDVGHFELIDPRSAVWPQVAKTIRRALA